MNKTDLNDIFKNISIMTKTGGLPKKTFLHPESDKDYYKRSSTGDILGKSRKNLSFVVPVTKLDERLKDVIWKKLQSILSDLKSFDSREISAALEANLLVSRSPDEKKLNEELQQKIEKNIHKMDQGDLRIVHKCAKLVGNGNLTTEQKEEIVNFFKKFENLKFIKTSPSKSSSIKTGENTPRTKTKGELKDTSQSRSTEESTSDEDGVLEQQLTTTKGKKQKPRAKRAKTPKTGSNKKSSLNDKLTLQQDSRTTKRKKQTQKAKESSEESESDDEETLQQESRSTKGKKQKQKPNLVKAKSMKKLPLNVEDSLVEESSSRKRKQTAKREPKDDPTKNQESRTPKGKEQTQTPPASKSKSMKKPPFNNEGSLAEESSSRKRKQKAKREPKDDPRKVKSSRKRPRLMQEDFGLSEVR